MDIRYDDSAVNWYSSRTGFEKKLEMRVEN